MSPQPSDALVKMAIIGARQVLKVLEREGSFPPMLVCRTADDYDVQVVLASDSKEASQAGRARAREVPASVQACVFMYDAVLNIGGERRDAVFIEGHERGQPQGFMFAQRYTGGGRDQRLEMIDKGVIMLGPVAPMLADPPG